MDVFGRVINCRLGLLFIRMGIWSFDAFFLCFFFFFGLSNEIIYIALINGIRMIWNQFLKKN